MDKIVILPPQNLLTSVVQLESSLEYPKLETECREVEISAQPSVPCSTLDVDRLKDYPIDTLRKFVRASGVPCGPKTGRPRVEKLIRSILSEDVSVSATQNDTDCRTIDIRGAGVQTT